ncbi:MAG: CocE/NonD family hydrolase [Alphaproteobacteria bacterium]|nr:CocE/NonD family hydrolase [Alphaproteobacteria bacterium]
MLALLAAAWGAPLPPRTAHVRSRDTVDVVARDGVVLPTRMFVPSGDGPFPTVLTRTPYYMAPILDEQCRLLVRRGYACVWQEIRGRLHAGGEWSPFVNEERDGQDAVAWIREQPWSDGRVAWLGDSYLSAAGWAVAAEDPDGLVTLVSRIFGPDLYDSAFESGLLRHELFTAWMSLMPDGRTRWFAAGPYHRSLQHRPRVTMDTVAAGHEVPWFRDWITAEEATDPRWQDGDPGRFERAAENTSIPVLLIGGWSDAFVEAQVDTWQRLGTRDRSLLVIGPWAHLGQAPAAIPLRHVKEPAGNAFQLARVLDWLAVQVEGEAPTLPTTGAITYVIGGDRWEQRDDWPPPTIERRYGLVAGEDPCEGALVAGDAPTAPMSWTYDPEDPLPSRGGAGLLAGAIPLMNGVKPGFVHDRTRCPRRDDVLRFVSEPLDAPLHLAGRMAATLEVASDAADTAFGFRLLEKRRNGEEIVLREGFSTLALRDGPPRRPYTPGERVTVTPDTQPLEVELHEGSRIVVVLTSSSFPAVEAHPNVAGVIAEATGTRVAHQQVFAGTLLLPEVVE